MDTDMAKPTLSFKLMIDTTAHRVLFAETNKACVDFLFHILSLPVAAVVNLLKKQGMVGSIANLYESIENLDESYIQPNQSKDSILKPVDSTHGSSASLLLLKEYAPTPKKFYLCNQCPYNVSFSDDPRAVCPNCKRNMTAPLPYVAPPAAAGETASCDEGGFVRGLVTYMVMDDLVVKPMSAVSTITLLNKFNVKDVGQLKEKVVELGIDKAVNLLKASLQSERVLTDVFLKGYTKGSGIKEDAKSRRLRHSISRSLSSSMNHRGAEKEAVVISKSLYRRSLRKQSSGSEVIYKEEPRTNLSERDSTKLSVEKGDKSSKTSVVRPLHKAAQKVQSYNQRKPMNAKMKSRQ